MMAGRMRHFVTFQERSTVADGMGGETVTWSDVLTTWATLTPLSSSEQLETGKVEHNITHRLYIRYRPGIAPAQRVKYVDPTLGSTRIFQIRSIIDPEERHERLELMIEETHDAESG
jgi:SPP1 family predicted phage head-tail adaptor